MGQNRPPEPTTRTTSPHPAVVRAMPPLAGPADPSLHVDPLAIRDRPPASDEPIQVRRGGVKWPMNSATAVGTDAAQIRRALRDPEGARVDEPERETDEEPPSWDEELFHWWVKTATGDIRGSIAKIVQYGGRGAAYDLIATGHDLAALNGRTVGDEEAAELAVLSYLASKVNRMWAAAIDGRRGSDDTLFDISYYSFMARRIRAVGGWPVASKEGPTA